MNRRLIIAAAALGATTLVPNIGAVQTPASAADDTHSSGQPERVAGSVAPAAGGSGSIVYLKGYNVWISDGAGSGVRPLTHDGTRAIPYASPTESDTGVVAAGHGGLIVRMDQHGTVLSQFNPPGLVNTVGETMDGAVNDVALSPNGLRVAWSFVRYSCPVGADCMVRYATGFSTAAAYHSIGAQSYYRAPSWINNNRVLQTGGSGSQVMLQNVGAAASHWFDDWDMNFPSTDLADGELSPNGRLLAQVRGYGASSTIAWYAVNGNAKTGPAPALPTYLCFTNPDPAHASPTWSPDSRTVAWASTDGIYIQPDAAHCGEAAPARLILPAASAPDWSAADLQP